MRRTTGFESTLLSLRTLLGIENGILQPAEFFDTLLVCLESIYAVYILSLAEFFLCSRLSTATSNRLFRIRKLLNGTTSANNTEIFSPVVSQANVQWSFKVFRQLLHRIILGPH